MKTFVIGLVMLLIGLAIGYPVGRTQGIEVGAEWSIFQASMVAKEAGVNMPVTYKNGEFKLILNQPKKFYRQAYLLAKNYEIKN